MKYVTLLACLLLVSCIGQADEIAGCNSEQVKDTLMSGTFEKLKTRAINTEHSGTPGPNTPQILASLNKWNSNLVNVRQQSYDKANNTRFCEADFEYQNTPPTTVLMLLMFGEDPTCAKAVRYKVQPLQDQPDRFYVSWVCVE